MRQMQYCETQSALFQPLISTHIIQLEIETSIQIDVRRLSESTPGGSLAARSAPLPGCPLRQALSADLCPARKGWAPRPPRGIWRAESTLPRLSHARFRLAAASGRSHNHCYAAELSVKRLQARVLQDFDDTSTPVNAFRIRVRAVLAVGFERHEIAGSSDDRVLLDRRVPGESAVLVEVRTSSVSPIIDIY